MGTCRLARSISKSRNEQNEKVEGLAAHVVPISGKIPARKIKRDDRRLRKLDSRIFRIALRSVRAAAETYRLHVSSRIRSSSSKPFPSPFTPVGVSIFFFFLYVALLLVEAQEERETEKWAREKEKGRGEGKREKESKSPPVSKNIFMELPLRFQASVAATPSFCLASMASARCIGSPPNGAAIVNRTEILGY